MPNLRLQLGFKYLHLGALYRLSEINNSLGVPIKNSGSDILKYALSQEAPEGPWIFEFLRREEDNSFAAASGLRSAAT